MSFFAERPNEEESLRKLTARLYELTNELTSWPNFNTNNPASSIEQHHDRVAEFGNGLLDIKSRTEAKGAEIVEIFNELQNSGLSDEDYTPLATSLTKASDILGDMLLTTRLEIAKGNYFDLSGVLPSEVISYMNATTDELSSVVDNLISEVAAKINAAKNT